MSLLEIAHTTGWKPKLKRLTYQDRQQLAEKLREARSSQLASTVRGICIQCNGPIRLTFTNTMSHPRLYCSTTCAEIHRQKEKHATKQD